MNDWDNYFMTLIGKEEEEEGMEEEMEDASCGKKR
jgi:hypothetical protein